MRKVFTKDKWACCVVDIFSMFSSSLQLGEKVPFSMGSLSMVSGLFVFLLHQSLTVWWIHQNFTCICSIFANWAREISPCIRGNHLTCFFGLTGVSCCWPIFNVRMFNYVTKPILTKDGEDYFCFFSHLYLLHSCIHQTNLLSYTIWFPLCL